MDKEKKNLVCFGDNIYEVHTMIFPCIRQFLKKLFFCEWQSVNTFISSAGNLEKGLGEKVYLFKIKLLAINSVKVLPT